MNYLTKSHFSCARNSSNKLDSALAFEKLNAIGLLLIFSKSLLHFSPHLHKLQNSFRWLSVQQFYILGFCGAMKKFTA